jgi:hypothetical protein
VLSVFTSSTGREGHQVPWQAVTRIRFVRPLGMGAWKKRNVRGPWSQDAFRPCSPSLRRKKRMPGPPRREAGASGGVPGVVAAKYMPLERPEPPFEAAPASARSSDPLDGRRAPQRAWNGFLEASVRIGGPVIQDNGDNVGVSPTAYGQRIRRQVAATAACRGPQRGALRSGRETPRRRTRPGRCGSCPEPARR